jgi:hypothetical protein
MLLLLIGAFVMVPSLLNFRSVGTWIVLGAFVVVLTVAITVGDNLAVRPLLRDVPRSAQKIRLTNMVRRQGEAMSVTALVIFTLIFVVAGTTNAYQALTSERGTAFGVIGAICFALFAIAFAGMLVAKLRARRAIPVSELTVERLAAQLTRMELGWNVVAVAVGVLVVIAGVAGLLALLFHQSGTVSAQTFTIRNAKGDIAARFTETDGLPSLHLYDGDKKLRAILTVAADGPPSLTFYDGDKKSRATIVIHKDNPFIILKDANGNLRWSAFVTERGPYLGLSDSKGTVRWSVSVDDGGAHVRAFDASGKELPTQK